MIMAASLVTYPPHSSYSYIHPTNKVLVACFLSVDFLHWSLHLATVHHLNGIFPKNSIQLWGPLEETAILGAHKEVFSYYVTM